MMIGTAGHIDHGKTSLVRALTGTDTDRLPEEKKRGMSIELGFAFLPVAQVQVPGGVPAANAVPNAGAAGVADDSGVAAAAGTARPVAREPIAFIDVPGHEKLLHTMIAGATGIDFALLLVAADDGIMPQTREHLAVLSLLGIRRGAVALTKIDRSDAARIREVQADIAALLAPTPLAGIPVFPVSSATGEGIDALRAHLLAEAVRNDEAVRAEADMPGPAEGFHPARREEADSGGDTGRDAGRGADGDSARNASASPGAADAFRLAIDRVFSLDGVGTVVTGTVHAGCVQVGDVLAQMPQGAGGLRVRSLHAQNRRTDTAHAGQRCAINLAGVERDTLQRGQWLAQPDISSVSDRLDVTLTLWHEEPRALRSGMRVHVHLGTSATPAAVAVLDGDTLAPGQTGLVQLVLPKAVAAWHGDRLIVRDAAGQRIIGGGMVLTGDAPARYRRTLQRLQLLRVLQRDGLRARLAGLLDVSETGVDLLQWQRILGLKSVAVFDALLSGAEGGRTGGGHVGGGYGPGLGHVRLSAHLVFGRAVWQHLTGTVVQALAHHHEVATEEIGPDAARLRRLARLKLDDAHWRLVLDALVREGHIVQTGAFVHLPGHGAELAARDQTLLERLTPHLLEAGMQGAWVRDLAAQTGDTPNALRPAMARLARGGHIYQIVKDLYVDARTAAALAALVRKLAQQAREPLPVLTVAAFRDASGLGRKRAVQVLEFFDRIGLCRRVGDAHVLRMESALFQ